MTYSVTGSYFESCNCDPVCPCRMVDDIPGGRSTYGVCFGTLSWLIEEGRIGDVDVSGLAVALAYRYDDDEPGSPWELVLYLDAAGGERQLAALEDVFLGRLGGPKVGVLPWIRKARDVVDVRTNAIEITRDGSGHVLRVGDAVRLRAARPAAPDAAVRCIVPGYDEPGQELVADEHVVHDDPFDWELAENCAYASRFTYASE
jgi:hypothetical protein